MFSTIDITVALVAAAILVLFVGSLVYFANARMEQHEMDKLNIRWIALKNRS
jgi:hypothetical protein